MAPDKPSDRERTPFAQFLRVVGAELADVRNRRAPSTLRRTGWRRLSTATVPFDTESLRGLVYRACTANDLPNSCGLLQFLGQQHRNRVLVSEDPNIDPAEIAHAIRVADHEILSRQYDLLKPGRISFFGLELNKRSIDTRTRRFSPNALRQPGQQFHRALWELRDIPFCLDGWDMLQDRCGCEKDGVVQGWTRTLTKIGECDKCGDPLHWLEPFEVPEAMRPALELLRAIIEPVPERRRDAVHLLPESLRETDRSAIFDLIVRLANAIDPEAPQFSVEMPGERLGALHQACAALGAWPAGIDRISWHNTIKERVIRSIRSRWHALQPSLVARRPRTPQAKRSRRKHAPVGIRPATEIAKLSRQMLLEAWEHRLVTPHLRIHGALTLPAFDPVELERFGSEWRNRIKPDAFAHSIGISYYGVEQMVALGVIIADARALPGTGPHFTPENAADLMAKLAEATIPMSKTLVSLTETLLLIGGRPKPWGPILAALTNGSMPFRLRKAARPIDRILITRDDAVRLRGMTFDREGHPDISFSEWMVQRDALEMLNISAAGARLLSGIDPIGKNPKTYAVADVERRAAEIVSIPEIAAHIRTDTATAYKRICQQPTGGEIIPGGWDRSMLAALR